MPRRAPDEACFSPCAAFHHRQKAPADAGAFFMRKNAAFPEPKTAFLCKKDGENRAGLPERGPVPFRKALFSCRKNSPPVLTTLRQNHAGRRETVRPLKTCCGRARQKGPRRPPAFAPARRGKPAPRFSSENFGAGPPDRRPGAERACVQRRLPRLFPRAVPWPPFSSERRPGLKNADRAPPAPGASNTAPSDFSEAPG